MRQCLLIVVFWIMTPCGLVGEYVMPPCRLKVTHYRDLEYHSIFTPSYCHPVHVISCPCIIMFFRFKVELIPFSVCFCNTAACLIFIFCLYCLLPSAFPECGLSSSQVSPYICVPKATPEHFSSHICSA